MYALSKRVISQYIRTGCRRRLRLDLYGSDAARRTAGVPLKDTARPGLRLLTEQGRQFEREKFAEELQLRLAELKRNALCRTRTPPASILSAPTRRKIIEAAPGLLSPE